MVTEKIPEPKTIDSKTAPSASEQKADNLVRNEQDLTFRHRGPKKPAQHTPDSSYQNYLFGNAGSTGAPAWSDSAKGRALIRLVSRGMVGATFFVVGGRIANKHLENYNKNLPWDRSKPLQAIAKGIDLTLGRAIEKTVTTFAKYKNPSMAKLIGEESVKFRDSRTYAGSGFKFGRSYGADIVGFTFDFAMASVGDASTRSIIQAFDPNIKKSWLVNDNGTPAKKGEHKHFLPGEWLKAVGKTTWRVFSKNQGEDWAAAIPYAFQMKFQRQFLSNVFEKRWAGHKLVFDQSWNGGAYRIDPKAISARNPHGIVGDYQLVGALDLHARFVGYNWYTLMFREGYDSIGNAFNRWKENGYKISVPLPDHFNIITTPIDTALHAARYVTKSFIKANLYMNPAVVPFWLMRVPQSKWRGKYYIEPGQEGFDKTSKKTNIWKSPNEISASETILDPYARSNYEHFRTDTKLDHAEKLFSRTLNPIGWVSYKAGTAAANLSDRILGRHWQPKSKFVNTVLLESPESGIDAGRRKFVHEIVDASFAYTPYMWAKAETALRVDDNKGDGKLGQMDVAIYKLMDDVASFRFKSVPEDIKKMWNLGIHFERDLKVREGGEPDAQEVVKAPKTTVQASTARHDPVMLDGANKDATNDTRYNSEKAANDAHIPQEQQDDHAWVKRVAGSDINPAHIHRSSPTLH